MQNLITIYCKNTKEYVQIPCGTSLKELAEQLSLDMRYPVVAARVNYKVQNLNFLIYKPSPYSTCEDSNAFHSRWLYLKTQYLWAYKSKS